MFTRIVVVVAISLVKVPCRAAAATPPPPPPVETSDCQLSSHLCKPSSLSLVKTVMNIASVTGCQELCAKDESKKCKFVTFTNFRNIATCHLLAHCDDKVGTSFTSTTTYLYFPLSCRRATRWRTAARPPPRAMPRPGPSSAPSWRSRARRRSSGTAETSTLTIATFPRGLSAPPRKYPSRSALHTSQPPVRQVPLLEERCRGGGDRQLRVRRGRQLEAGRGRAARAAAAPRHAAAAGERGRGRRYLRNNRRLLMRTV